MLAPASHADNDVVTLSVDQVTFMASINYTGTSSMEVGTSTAVFFTMVTVDRQG